MKKKHPKKNGRNHDKVSHPNENETQHNDKCNKIKEKKTDKHCNFCDHDGHIESKCFKKLENLEATMEKHNIHLDTSSTSSFG